ncbi:MAG: hypothetical protein ACK4G4_11195, partial [Thermus sp.]
MAFPTSRPAGPLAAALAPPRGEGFGLPPALSPGGGGSSPEGLPFFARERGGPFRWARPPREAEGRRGWP